MTEPRRVLLAFEQRGVAPGARAVAVHHVRGMKRLCGTQVVLPADLQGIFCDVRLKTLDTGDWVRIERAGEEFGLYGTMFELSATNRSAITVAFRAALWAVEA